MFVKLGMSLEPPRLFFIHVLKCLPLAFLFIFCPCVEVMAVVVTERPPGGSEDALSSLDVSREESAVADRVRMYRYRDWGPVLILLFGG
jgi:hypothetical protein